MHELQIGVALLVLIAIAIAVQFQFRSRRNEVKTLRRRANSTTQKLAKLKDQVAFIGASSRRSAAEFIATLPSDNYGSTNVNFGYLPHGTVIQFPTDGPRFPLSCNNITRVPGTKDTFQFGRVGAYVLSYTFPILGASVIPGQDSLRHLAVYASDTITNTGPTVIYGDVGASAVLGFPPGVIHGRITSGAENTYNDAHILALQTYLLELLAGPTIDPGPDLAGQTYTPGIYVRSPPTLPIIVSPGGVVTLSGRGTYIFSSNAFAGDAFTVGAGATLVLTNGALARDVFWSGSNDSMTFGANVSWLGTVINIGDIFLGAGGTYQGFVASSANIVHMNTVVVRAFPPYEGQLVVAMNSGVNTTFSEQTNATLTGVDNGGLLSSTVLIRTTVPNTQLRIQVPNNAVGQLLPAPNAGGVNPVVATLVIYKV